MFFGILVIPHQKDISFYAQAARSGNAKAHVQYLITLLQHRGILDPLGEMGDKLFFQALIDREEPDIVDPENELFILEDRSLPDQLFLFLLTDLFQECTYDAVSCLWFEIAGLPPSQRGVIYVHEHPG